LHTDTLILTIEQQSSIRENMSVISNFLRYDDQDIATGFSDTMITSSSSTEATMAPTKRRYELEAFNGGGTSVTVIAALEIIKKGG